MQLLNSFECTVYPWTAQVWTAWVHLYADFFSLNMYHSTTPSAVGWIGGCGGPTVKLHADFQLCRGFKVKCIYFSADIGVISVHKNVLFGLSYFSFLGYLLIHSYRFYWWQVTFGKHRCLRPSLFRSSLLFFLCLLLGHEKWHLVIVIIKWLAYWFVWGF